ncbi:MAG: aldo/keto reductase [Fimbriimonadaceae bacterium]|nr:aldo/keto reductase [Fimbriimonadaceae bacterium]
MSLSRRQFLRAASAAAVGGSALAYAEPKAQAPMPKRPFGKTGWNASIYALGSAEIPATPEAVRAIHRLIDGGVNYLDTAPSYQGTRSESALGEVLKTRRPSVFVATKTLERSADGALREVAASKGRLGIDRIDLIQIHAVNDDATLDQVLAKGGALEGLRRAQRDGLVAHVGITGHTRPEVILRAIETGEFESILVPVSPLDHHVSDFATEVLPRANALGIGVTGMKALKGIERASGGKFEAEAYLRYAWTLPVSTLTIGLRRESEVEPNLALARAFKPMPKAEREALEAKSKEWADVGVLWWKKR